MSVPFLKLLGGVSPVPLVRVRLMPLRSELLNLAPRKPTIRRPVSSSTDRKLGEKQNPAPNNVALRTDFFEADGADGVPVGGGGG